MSDLTQRILVALVAIPIIVALCMAGGVYFFLFVAAASALALAEFYRIAATKGAQPLGTVGLIAGFFINLSFFHAWLQQCVLGIFESHRVAIPFPSQAQLLQITLIVIVVVLSLIELFRNKGSAILNLSTTFLGIAYISLFFGTFIGLREAFTVSDSQVAYYFFHTGQSLESAEVYRAGGLTVVAVLAIIWICDTAAFHVGKKWGRHKLFPRVSPNKSWEGAIAGFVAAILSAILAKLIALGYLTLGSAIVIGVIVGVIGQLGDLAESLLKRDAGVKDSSTLIPGHGGVFDRFDSLLLVSPCVYLYIDFIVFS